MLTKTHSPALTLTRYFWTAATRPDAVLERQLIAADAVLQQVVTVPLLDHQRQALQCLVSDVRAGLAETPTRASFEQSFLLTALNKGMFAIAAGEFFQFCYHRGAFNTRVWQKRKAEHYLFSRGDLWFED